MIRIDATTVQLTQQELKDIKNFIDGSLYASADRHFSNYIRPKGMTQAQAQEYVNPYMYALMKKMEEL